MKKLTRAEEEIMQAVWALGECTVGDIRTYLETQLQLPKPAQSTVSTVARILLEKGFLEHRAYGRTFVYSPRVSKEDYSRQSIKQLVSDYFGGSANRLVSFLVKQEDLSLEELNRLVEKLDPDQKSKP
ncbi:MAG: BlaI/MecI/CopY family transcriptional regulator [Saprospirales bacterium]|nr:BlaI/MecI/CopY family transcriptional regulator [Saprospirales bacterium]